MRASTIVGYRNGWAAGYKAAKQDSKKTGQWIIGLDGSYMCSECRKVFRYEIGNYCSNCGIRLMLKE